MVLADMKIPAHSWNIEFICMIVRLEFAAEVLLKISVM
jgi:hypothetical protein